MRALPIFAGFALTASLLATEPAHAEGDPEQGKIKSQTCIGCHGIPGYTNAYPTYRVPKISGQHAEQVVTAIEGYQSGARRHPTMTAQASSMNTQDMQDIAAYLDSLKPEAAITAPEQVDPPAAAAVCMSCHGPTGLSPTPQLAPVIAGQYRDYLVRALRDYKTGARDNAIMKTFAGQLSEEQIEALAAWFSRQETPLRTLPKE